MFTELVDTSGTNNPWCYPDSIDPTPCIFPKRRERSNLAKNWEETTPKQKMETRGKNQSGVT
jgi:hypothetical protein